MDFANQFSEKGEWWIPENDSIKCFGELIYEPNGSIILTFYGSLLQSKNIYKSQSNAKIKMIFGKTQTGKHVTLFDAFGHETGSDIILESTYYISYAIVNNRYLSTPDTDKFDLISLNLNCSEAFFSKLYKTMEEEAFDLHEPTRKFKYDQTDSKLLFKDATMESSLFFSYSYNRSRNDKEEFTFSQRVLLNTNIETPLNFHSSIAFAKNLKAIFSFFSTYRIFFNHLKLRETETKEFFDVIFAENRRSNERLRSIDLLADYENIRNEFEAMFKWWIANYDFTVNGLSLYLQLLNSRIESFPQRFLSIVFALETLHSSLLDKKPFTDEQYSEFKAIKKKVIVDKKFKKRFDECLSQFNSMSFSSRVHGLIKNNSDLLRDFIYDVNDFVLKIKSQRNFFAHNHSEPNDSLIPEEHQDYFIDVCKLIYEVSFLNITGISKKNIEKMIKGNFFHTYFKSKMPIRITEP